MCEFLTVKVGDAYFFINWRGLYEVTDTVVKVCHVTASSAHCFISGYSALDFKHNPPPHHNHDTTVYMYNLKQGYTHAD